METVVVERRFDAPVAFEALQRAEEALEWCLVQHAVRPERSYLSLDGCSMVCIYAAPDAEAVRATQRRGGLPFERAWAAHVLGGAQQPCAGPGRSTIVVQRELPTSMQPAEVMAVMASGGHCLSLHRANHLTSYLSREGTRLVCVFEALDAESVRMVSRGIGVPVGRAWPASFHGAHA